MAREEREALRFVAEQHRGEVAVADADLAAVRDGPVDAEALEPDPDGAGSFLGVLRAGFQCDRRADAVRPADVLEADRLNALCDLIGIETGLLADLAALFHGSDAVFGQHAVDLCDPAVVVFK